MKKVLILLLLLTVFTGFAQINYETGYFIDNNGTKTECLIKNLAWKDSPVQFEYKADETAEPKIALLKNVSEFNVGSYKFKRFEVNIDRSSATVDKMSDYKEPKWLKETIYLKVLIEGKINLYVYEDSNLIKYFYSDGNHSKATQLLYKEYITKGQIGQNTMYKQQLYNLMRDKYADSGKFEKTAYKKEPLVKLFMDYNGTDATVKNLSAGHNKGNVNLKINTGASLATIKVEDNYNNRLDFKAGSKAVFMAGLELEYIMPFNNNKWSIFTAPNVQFYKNNGTEQISATTKINWAIDYNFIELPFGMRHYMFLNNESKIFIDIAYVMSFPLGDSKLTYNTAEPIDFNKSSNFMIGAGYSYKKYSAALKYTFNRGTTSQYTSWNAQYNAIGLILGYKLF